MSGLWSFRRSCDRSTSHGTTNNNNTTPLSVLQQELPLTHQTFQSVILSSSALLEPFKENVFRCHPTDKDQYSPASVHTAECPTTRAVVLPTNHSHSPKQPQQPISSFLFRHDHGVCGIGDTEEEEDSSAESTSEVEQTAAAAVVHVPQHSPVEQQRPLSSPSFFVDDDDGDEALSFKPCRRAVLERIQEEWWLTQTTTMEEGVHHDGDANHCTQQQPITVFEKLNFAVADPNFDVLQRHTAEQHVTKVLVESVGAMPPPSSLLRPIGSPPPLEQPQQDPQNVLPLKTQLMTARSNRMESNRHQARRQQQQQQQKVSSNERSCAGVPMARKSREQLISATTPTLPEKKSKVMDGTQHQQQVDRSVHTDPNTVALSPSIIRNVSKRACSSTTLKVAVSTAESILRPRGTVPLVTPADRMKSSKPHAEARRQQQQQQQQSSPNELSSINQPCVGVFPVARKCAEQPIIATTPTLPEKKNKVMIHGAEQQQQQQAERSMHTDSIASLSTTNHNRVCSSEALNEVESSTAEPTSQRDGFLENFTERLLRRQTARSALQEKYNRRALEQLETEAMKLREADAILISEKKKAAQLKRDRLKRAEERECEQVRKQLVLQREIDDAQIIHRRLTLKYHGWLPWKRYVRTRRQDQLQATTERNQRHLHRMFLLWRTYTVGNRRYRWWLAVARCLSLIRLLRVIFQRACFRQWRVVVCRTRKDGAVADRQRWKFLLRRWKERVSRQRSRIAQQKVVWELSAIPTAIHHAKFLMLRKCFGMLKEKYGRRSEDRVRQSVRSAMQRQVQEILEGSK